MNMLNVKAFAGLLILLLVMAGLLFLPASANHFWQAWVFLAVFFAPALAVTVYLMKNDPELLERRMNGGPTAEKEPAQKIIMLLVSVGFIGLMVFPALDHRFGWSHMPPVVALAGDLLVLLGWLALYYVFRANTYAAATIQLAPDHKIISTGPYALVRHPMYAGFWLMALGQALLLPNWVAGSAGLVGFGILFFGRVGREEAMMTAAFGEEYRAYMRRTARVVPWLY